MFKIRWIWNPLIQNCILSSTYEKKELFEACYWKLLHKNRIICYGVTAAICWSNSSMPKVVLMIVVRKTKVLMILIIQQYFLKNGVKNKTFTKKKKQWKGRNRSPGSPSNIKAGSTVDFIIKSSTSVCNYAKDFFRAITDYGCSFITRWHLVFTQPRWSAPRLSGTTVSLGRFKRC